MFKPTQSFIRSCIVLWAIAWSVLIAAIAGCSRNDSHFEHNSQPIRPSLGLPEDNRFIGAQGRSLGSCFNRWHEAALVLHRHRDMILELPYRRLGKHDWTHPPDGQIASVSKFVEENRSLLASIHIACDCLVDGSPGLLGNDFDQIKALLHAFDLLELEAYGGTIRGDAAAAVSAFGRMWRLTQLVTELEEPSVRINTLRIMRGRLAVTTGHFLQRGQVSLEELERLQSELSQSGMSNLLLDSARYTRGDLLRRILYGKVQCNILWNCPWSESISPQSAANATAIWTEQFDLVDKLERAIRLGFPATLRSVESISAIAEDRVNYYNRLLGKGRWRSTLWIQVRDDVLGVAEIQASTDVVRAGVAVELFRRRTGHLPESLAEAFAADPTGVPTDPFDGLPIRFLVTSKGYRVYSVGEGATLLGNLDNTDMGAKRYLMDNLGRTRQEAAAVKDEADTAIDRESAYDISCVVEPESPPMPLGSSVTVSAH